MTDDFKEFEHQRWEAAVDQYDSSFSRLTQQTVPRMLEVLGISSQAAGTRFLDVACGPGYLTAEAARRGAQAVGVDFSAAMIDKARLHYASSSARDGLPNLSLNFQLGDAENLTACADASFDAAGMNFGILHLSNPEKAIREMHRVLVPGGRVAFTVWRRPEEAVGFALVLRALEKHGNPNLPLPKGPAFFQYSDPVECARILETCGFTHHVETLPLTWKLSSPDELFTAFYHGTARTGGLLRSQQPADLARIREAVCASALEYSQQGEVVIPMPAQLAWGLKGMTK